MKCFGTKVNRIFLSQRLMGSQEKWNCLYSCLQIWASTLNKKLAASPDLVLLYGFGDNLGHLKYADDLSAVILTNVM